MPSSIHENFIASGGEYIHTVMDEIPNPGSTISLITHAQVRYEGTLDLIQMQPEESSITLANGEELSYMLLKNVQWKRSHCSDLSCLAATNLQAIYVVVHGHATHLRPRFSTMNCQLGYALP